MSMAAHKEVVRGVEAKFSSTKKVRRKLNHLINCIVPPLVGELQNEWYTLSPPPCFLLSQLVGSGHSRFVRYRQNTSDIRVRVLSPLSLFGAPAGVHWRTGGQVSGTTCFCDPVRKRVN
jgi:hypothetical protein